MPETQTSPEHDHDHDGLCVSSDVGPDGTYVLTVTTGPDTVFVLDYEAALRYVTHVVGAAARAEYDAAVIAQLASLGVPTPEAGLLIRQMRADRPPLASEWPISFEGIVASKTLRPEVTIQADGEPVGQVGTGALVEHALNVLDAVNIAELDNAYRRHLVGVVGLNDDSARAAVAGLDEHRRRT